MEIRLVPPPVLLERHRQLGFSIGDESVVDGQEESDDDFGQPDTARIARQVCTSGKGQSQFFAHLTCTMRYSQPFMASVQVLVLGVCYQSSEHAQMIAVSVRYCCTYRRFQEPCVSSFATCAGVYPFPSCPESLPYFVSVSCGRR